MNGKRKKKTLKQKQADLRAKKERKRFEQLAKEGRLVNGREIPRDAIAADVSQQAPNNSYSTKHYYQDIDFTCVDCGSNEVWKAKDQKGYFEVVKGPIYGRPIRCRSCRKKFREADAAARSRIKNAERNRWFEQFRSEAE